MRGWLMDMGVQLGGEFVATAVGLGSGVEEMSLLVEGTKTYRTERVAKTDLGAFLK